MYGFSLGYTRGIRCKLGHSSRPRDVRVRKALVEERDKQLAGVLVVMLQLLGDVFHARGCDRAQISSMVKKRKGSCRSSISTLVRTAWDASATKLTNLSNWWKLLGRICA